MVVGHKPGRPGNLNVGGNLIYNAVYSSGIIIELNYCLRFRYIIKPLKSKCQPKAGGDIKEGEKTVNIPVMEYEPADKAEIWLVNSRLSSIELEELCAEFDED